jgi:hypothetical protein
LRVPHPWPLLALLLAISPSMASRGQAAWTAGGAGQNALAVPSSDAVYDDLDHFRALGLWAGDLELRPASVEELRRAVEQIRRNPASAALAPGDRVRLERLIQTLCADTTETARPAGHVIPPVAWHFGFALRGVGVSSPLDSLPDLARRPRRDWTFAFSQDVQIGERLSVQSRFYEDYSRLSPYPRRDWTDHLPTSAKGILQDPSARNDRAVVGLHGSWWDLRYGREDRRLGVGRHGTLFLSENAFPLDGLSLRLSTRYLSLASLMGQSQRRPDAASADSGMVRGDAYVAAHRIEFRSPWPRTRPVRLGFFEAAAYGGRGLDLGYANPFAILVAFTQDVYDRFQADDKKVVGGDLQVDLHPVSLYGELLLNRLISMDQASAGEQSEISSLGQLAGLRWADPFRWGGADLDLEYAHLDPEVYFHKDRDPNRALLSGGEVLGHWLGPDADDLFASLAAPPNARWGTVRCYFEQARWGLLGGLRGTAAGFVGLRKKDKRWITGEVQRERTTGLEWRRDGWKAPIPGLFDTGVTLAWVDRAGPGRAGSGAWSDQGLCCELRLTWRLDFLWRQPAVPL